jgi:hypothetical protein
VFVFVNSIFALLGIAQARAISLPWDSLPLFAMGVGIGSWIGTYLGVFRYSLMQVQRALGVVLLIAALKLLSLALGESMT